MAADVTDAERTVAELNTMAQALADTEALARLLLRAESVASSFIEGLVVGGHQLLRAEAAAAVGEQGSDAIAEEVLRGTRLSEHAGEIREVQNWIGGSGFNPRSAAPQRPEPAHQR